MADTSGSLDKSIITFKGINGDECDVFIAAVEELAYAEGWSEDRRRMLLFARSRLRNAALRWFSRLDQSIQTDWYLFIQALFDQYPPVTELPRLTDGPEAATPVWSATTLSPSMSTVALPTASTADYPDVASSSIPPATQPIQDSSRFDDYSAETLRETILQPCLASKPDDLQSELHLGRLRIVCKDAFPPAYIRNGVCPAQVWSKRINDRAVGGHGIKSVTWNQADALVVCFKRSSEPHSIACWQNDDARLNLGVIVAPNLADFHPMFALRDIKTARESRRCANYWEPPYQMVSKIWNVLEDGTLQATLSDFIETTDGIGFTHDAWGTVLSKPPSPPINWTTTTVYMDTAGVPISFAKDSFDPPDVHPETGRPLFKARIVFEPL